MTKKIVKSPTAKQIAHLTAIVHPCVAGVGAKGPKFWAECLENGISCGGSTRAAAFKSLWKYLANRVFPGSTLTLRLVRSTRVCILQCLQCGGWATALNGRRVSKHKCVGAWTTIHTEYVVESEVRLALLEKV